MLFRSNNPLNTSTFSSPTGFTVYPSLLDPTTLNFSNFGTLNPGVGPVNVAVTSSDTTVGTITTSPLVFNTGDTSKTSNFKPVGAGSTTVAIAAAANGSGFSTPANYQTFTANVTAPTLSISSPITGVKLQTTANAYLPVAPPSPLTVTVTVADPTVALISSSSTTVGGTTLTFPNISAAGYVPTIYVQGLKVGTTTLTVSAAGFTSASGTVTVKASGFTTYYSQAINTTTFSQPSGVTVYPAMLDPTTLAFYNFGTLSPGVGPVSVSVTSSNTVVGTISTSPLIFNTGDTYQNTTFQPTSAGTSTISLSTPLGFSTPSNYTTQLATVTAPALSISDLVTGVGLEGGTNVYLPVTPPNPVTVTVTSNGTAIAVISKDGTVIGGTTLIFTNVSSAGYLPTIYVQGQSVGSTTLSVSAAGYTSATGNVTVKPSGFVLYYSNNTLSTTTTSSPSNVYVYPAILNPGTRTVYTLGAEVSPGVASSVTPLSVSVTSSSPAVGTITNSPVMFLPGDTQHYVTFTPLTSGTTNLDVVQPTGLPTGFTTPSTGTETVVTVQ